MGIDWVGIDRVEIDSGGNWFGWEIIRVGIDLVGIDRVEILHGWELWVYQKNTKHKQIFIDWVRNDRVTNDQVRNDRGLKMIGSHLYIMIWVMFLWEVR